VLDFDLAVTSPGIRLAVPPPSRLPLPADHIALRALMKYMSGILGIPYKSLSSGTKFDESAVKNYTNDKSSRSLRAGEMYSAFCARCAEIISERADDLRIDDYAVAILQHLFGVKWLESTAIKFPASHRDPALDETLAKWLAVSPNENDEVEIRYSGLWWVLRSSAFQNSGKLSNHSDAQEVSCSLINVRPKSVSAGTLCDFRWYNLGKDREQDERRVFEGFVIPNVDRIEFLGRLSTRHKLLSLMVWRFSPDPELRDHAKVASGICLSLTGSGRPVIARVRAFFVECSENLHGDEFEAVKRAHLNEIGVRPVKFLESFLSPDQLQSTLAFLSEHKPIAGFSSARDEILEA
jgi:hypothetical protein